MSTSPLRLWLSILVLIPGLSYIQGCGKSPEPEALLESSSLFAYVPADTPFVYGNVKPAPQAFVDKMFRIYGDMGQMYMATFEQARKNYSLYLRQAREEGRQSGDAVPADEPVSPFDDDGLGRLADAVVAEFDGRMTPEGLRELGFRTDGTAVIYGLGLLPVARFELADAAKVNALIRRIETRSGMQGDWQRFGNVDYLRVGDERAAIVLGTVGEQMVTALLPSALEEEYLPRVFGDQRPERSLLDSGIHAELIKTHGFTGYGEGYVDFRRIARILTGRDEGEAADLLAALEVDTPRPSPACVQLLDSLTAGSPRHGHGCLPARRAGHWRAIGAGDRPGNRSAAAGPE